MDDQRAAEDLRTALSEFGYGNLETALDLLDGYTARHGDHDDVTYARRQIRSRLWPAELRPPALLWRSGTHEIWERGWLDAVLPALSVLDPATPAADLANRRVVVVDKTLGWEHRRFYADAYRNNCQIILVHVQDERYEDDRTGYRWCHRIFRAYYSPVFCDNWRVTCFAPGYKSGLDASHGSPPAATRSHVWGFAGDAGKSNRAQMLAAMLQVPGGRHHLIGGWAAPDSLPTAAYLAFMKQSVFAPCPVGWVNLDTYRVYEALEAGCIPIVERRERYDYFAEAYGPVPFPAVKSWDEAPTLIAHLRRHDLVDELQLDCIRWWARYKAWLKSQFLGAVHQPSAREA